VYSSTDGVNWAQIGTTQSIPMAQNVFVGLVVCSDTNSALATATFDNVSIQ
jgi:regulation of enolase protein 1 (concanavalin A-like superfamily)